MGWPFHLHNMELSLYGLNVNRSVMPYFQYILLFLPCAVHPCHSVSVRFLVCCHVCYSQGYCPHHLLPIISSCLIFSAFAFLGFVSSLSFSLWCLDSLCSFTSGCEYCWWEKPLVVVLKHSEGIKHTVLFQEQKLTNTKSLQYTPSLFLSSVSLYYLSHRIT